MSDISKIDNFEYNTQYVLDSEHKWDFMKDDKKAEKYYEEREKIMVPNIGHLQSDEDKIGQVGNLK